MNYPNNVIAILSVFVSFLVHADNQSLLIEEVTLIDGTGRPAIEHASVLVTNERITEIRRDKFAEEGLRSKTKIIDGRGKYLIPGLMDVHIHLVGGVKVTKDGLRKVGVDRKKGIRALQGYLYSGVTSVYDSGNIPEYIFSLRKDERSGKLVSPRIFATGGIVTYPGSHGSGPGATLIDDWPEAIPLLDEHIKYQPDIVKLTLEERGWGTRPMIPKLPLSLMEKVVEYYNERGIRVTVHTPSEIRARQAIYTGVDSLSHPVIVGPINDSFVKLIATKKTPVATTLTIGENYSRLVERPEYLDQMLYQSVLTQEEISELKTKTRKAYQDRTWTWWMKLMTPIAQENIRQIAAAGGVMALGTDHSNGAAVHREMELLVAAGIAPVDVIRIATLNGAKFLGKEDDLGSITEGKLADMVLLDADPSVDINNAKKISIVIKNGVVIDREKLKIPANKN